MKQIFQIVMALVAIVLWSTSCDKNALIEQNPSAEVKMQPVTLTASIASDPQTKTAIGEEVIENGKKYRKVVWVEGDKIGAVVNVDGTETTYEFSLTAGADTEEGTFEGQIPEGATISKALYPYIDSGSASITATQVATPGSFDPSVSLMEAPRNAEGKLVFEHKAAYLKVTTTEPYKKISVRSDATTGFIPIELVPSGNNADIAAGEYYIAISPCTLSGFDVLVNDKLNNRYKKSTTKGLSLEDGKIVNLGSIEKSTLESVPSFLSAVDLSTIESANSYIISGLGEYKFKAVKGNSNETVGNVAEINVLWETFGTNISPNEGDLIADYSYSDGYVYVKTSESKGNASIAVKDANGSILWSWHIWMTDKPADQEYYNNAGTMMDRNLGATSATPGDVGALGLLYQWGRKDPFLSGCHVSYADLVEQARAASTLTWPELVNSDATTGTIAYAQANPTTFIKYNSSNYDWYYTGSSSTDNTRWQSTKTIYDPCPPGWRVPDGGSNGVWSTALGSSSGFTDQSLYNSTTRGFNFSNKFGGSSMIWYPTAGGLDISSGQLYFVGSYGFFWSVTPNSNNAYSLGFKGYGDVNPSNYGSRAGGLSVRCWKEVGEPKDLAEDGKTANSYIVSSAGKYKFPTVQGNSVTSVGSVASVEVLWETFGTSTAPNVGDLVKKASYSDGYITFDATNKKGNASIAAKDASGKILWSWHIWLTDQPEAQVYYNNAGTMMDRNLGATSATPGDVEALGLLYQWGRKDPFLGGSAISYSSSSNQAKAASTLTWPAAVTSDASNGTVAYAQANPTTFITYNSNLSQKNYDWYYTGTTSTDNTRWQSTKTIYDPCPPGWRVPDGGSNGVWSKALGSSSSFTDQSLYNSTTRGFNFSGKFGDSSMIWYPTAGCLSNSAGQLGSVGNDGGYWAVTPDSYYAYGLCFSNGGYVGPSYDSNRAYGLSVRCLQE